MNPDDELLRSRLSREPRVGSTDAHAALDGLRPAMRRARMKRYAAIGTTTFSLIGLGGAGVVAWSAAQEPTDVLMTTSPERTRPPVTVSDPDPDPDPDDEVSSSVPDRPVPTTTDAVDSDISIAPELSGADSPVESAPETSPPTLPTPPTSDSPGRPPVVVVETTVATTSTTTAATTTPPTASTAPPAVTTTSTTVPGERVIVSACGDVTVAYAGDEVELLGIDPDVGFAIDVKNRGPEEVEVGFAGGVDEECEVKARISNGTLVVEVDNHGR